MASSRVSGALRALVFAAQAAPTTGLWRRNGAAVAAQAANYGPGRCSMYMRDVSYLYIW